MQWFRHHHGGEDPDVEPGTKRQVPLKGSLHHQDGPLQAHLYLRWVGQNMPGYDYPRKAPVLVSTSGGYPKPTVLHVHCVQGESSTALELRLLLGWSHADHSVLLAGFIYIV